MVQVLRPDGAVDRPLRRLAAPRATLSGARIGVLDNLKPNAGLLMLTVAGELAARAGSPEPLHLTKRASTPAPDDHINLLVKEVDLVITGSAD
jgi:hypothetical protein